MIQVKFPMFKAIKLTPVRAVVLSYLVATIISTLLLSLEFSLKEGIKLSFVDSLFTSVSAISVTGLTVVNTAETFSTFGVFVLMFISQLGGIGLMTLGTLIYVLLGRKIGLAQRQLIMIDQNRYNLTGLVHIIKLIFNFAIIIELIGGAVFGIYFLIRGYFANTYEAFYYGFFHALSAYTNSGFDIFGNSLYRFSQDYFVQFVTVILLVLGAMGFPVLIELRAKLIGDDPKFRFSLYTKLTTATFFILVILGMMSIFLLERNLFLANLPWHEKFFHALFYSVTPRNGGLATLDVSVFSDATLVFLSILMFIGASPSSVGGGIRTTTLAVVFLTIYNFSKGQRQVRVFNKRLSNEDIMKSFVVFSTGILLVIISTVLLLAVEDHIHPLLPIIFEVTSAFGTTGLSLGITSQLSTAGKYILIFLMFVGRIGILCFLWMMKKPDRMAKISYPEERVIIG